MAKVSQATFNLISQLEGNRLKPYLDTKGLATVGIGVQVENEAGNRGEYLVILGIAEKIGSAYRVKTLYNTDGTKNETATNALETVYNTINSALQTNTSTASMQTAIDNALSSLQSNSVLNNYKSSFHTTCEITNDESKVLFEAVAKLHVDTTDNFLNTITGSEKLVISQNSNEYAALFSLAYNNANLLLGDGLKHSIQYGNRAEAWFQIRYQSNADSVQAKRRYAESEVFGLYANPNNPTEKELKDFIRMYRLHKSTIDAYEATYSSRIGDANADLEKAGFSQRVNTLAVEVNQAKQRLASLFGEGVTIDGDVIVGVDTVNDDSADRGAAQINDTLQGTSKNDYLFGERGDDILIGNGGGDYMEGGEGFDTYYTNDKDTIYDSDGKGEVYFNGTLLVGGLFDESSGFYVSEDKSIKYQLVGNTLKVKNLVDSSELTIEGYIQKEQSLGINLAKSLGKEVAIVIDTTGSMRSSIDTAKQQAAIIAGNIFKSNSLDSGGVFSKVSIVTFSDDNIKTIGTYYNQTSFQAGINKVNIEGGGYEYHCRALMEGMSNFTKDNGLDKQMFLITDEPGDDNERMGEVIAMANSFGSEMKLLSNLNSGESSYDNRVKINVISIGRNLTHLKRFSDETGGIFLETNSISELEDALFDVSNLGTMNDDIIFGNERDNILDGGAGDDLLYGGAGDDTYIFGYGYGNDLIHDYAYDVAGDSIDAGNDTVRFINGVTKDDLIVEDSGKDLIIKLKGSDDSLTIKGFYEEHTRVENFTFENGVALSADEIDELTKPNVIRGGFGNRVLHGTDRKDEIHGGVGRSEIYAKGGNDTIYSGIGNSYIDAGDGDDTIYGSVGKMVVRGGKGNDTMYGGIGKATYLFGKDDGDDLIVCGVGRSSILFDEEIEKESVFIASKDNNLFIQYSDEGSIVVKNHKRLKSISLNDGSYITSNDINRIIQEMNSFAASNDLDITNLNEMKNSDEFMQIVMSGWR